MMMNRNRVEVSKPRGRVNILLVEDNPGDARLLREFLAESQGLEFDLELAASICSAESRLAVGSFDVIFLDLSLPESEGKETFDRVRSSAGTTPIVILTGHDDLPAALLLKSLGAVEYLVKGSADAASVAGAIDRAIHSNREHDQRQALVGETTESIVAG